MPRRVSITPNTTHGCRPISVMIQPVEFARYGSAIASGARRRNQVALRSVPRRTYQSPRTETRIISIPAPTISRNAQ